MLENALNAFTCHILQIVASIDTLHFVHHVLYYFGVGISAKLIQIVCIVLTESENCMLLESESLLSTGPK